MNLNKITIRDLSSSDPISEITNLLHISYKELMDMGFRYVATHQDDNETKNRLIKGISYLGFSEDKIIATITLYFNKDIREFAEYYDRKDVAHFGQFAVLPDFQRTGIGSKLLKIVEKRAKNLGAKEIALDTAEGATHLISYYKKRGYRFFDYVQWEVTNYRSVIMSKKL